VATEDESSVIITLQSEHHLSGSDCFPDGIPTEWDATTILAAIERDGIAAWNLDGYGYEVRVTVSKPNPHFGQNEALFPDHAAEPYLRSEARGTAR
jgi:hypothetical protein